MLKFEIGISWLSIKDTSRKFRVLYYYCSVETASFEGSPEQILSRISHEEHLTEWKNNTILINYTLFYLKFGIADCNR